MTYTVPVYRGERLSVFGVVRVPETESKTDEIRRFSRKETD